MDYDLDDHFNNDYEVTYTDSEVTLSNIDHKAGGMSQVLQLVIIGN